MREFSSWWFINGGMLHRWWKTRQYSKINQAAKELPRMAWANARVNLFESVLKNIDEVGMEDTIAWMRSRLEHERKELSDDSPT